MGKVISSVPRGCLLIFDDFDDFGDDVAATFDGDEVADADAETGDLVGVVEGGAGDGGAADEDGLKLGDGSDLAGASGLKGDSEELSDSSAGGELILDRPARGFAGEAYAALLGGGVGLDDYAVDLVAEGIAEGFGMSDEGEDGVDVVDGAGVRVDTEAGGAEGFERGGLRDEECIPVSQEEVSVEVEAALGNDVGFERADRAGSGVAWVYGRGQTLGDAFLYSF